MPTAFADTATSVVERVGPAVVRIGRNGGRGCGVVIASGQVLTNAHNLRGREVTVTFADGHAVAGAAAGVDTDADLAVISVDTGDVEPIEWAEAVPKPGAIVYAVATSAFGGNRITFGMVSAAARTFRGPRGRRIAGSVEHTSPLPRGSSGSALVDDDGRLLGLNTHRIGDGFYLAVPAEQLRPKAEELARGEAPQHVRLGVAIAPAGVARKLRRSVGLPERDGLLVRGVEDHSPAAHAGLAVGDLLVDAGGRTLRSIDDLFDALDEAAPAGALSLHIVRGNDEVDARVDLSSDANGGADHGRV